MTWPAIQASCARCRDPFGSDEPCNHVGIEPRSEGTATESPLAYLERAIGEMRSLSHDEPHIAPRSARTRPAGVAGRPNRSQRPTGPRMEK